MIECACRLVKFWFGTFIANLDLAKDSPVSATPDMSETAKLPEQTLPEQALPQRVLPDRALPESPAKRALPERVLPQRAFVRAKLAKLEQIGKLDN